MFTPEQLNECIKKASETVGQLTLSNDFIDLCNMAKLAIEAREMIEEISNSGTASAKRRAKAREWLARFHE